jgi:hypothetical protein
MGTLGAVYGISFVAGSLASMGSAYMASQIYPIEDEGEDINLLVKNSEVTSQEGGVKNTVKSLQAAIDAAKVRIDGIIAKKQKGWQIESANIQKRINGWEKELKIAKEAQAKYDAARAAKKAEYDAAEAAKKAKYDAERSEAENAPSGPLSPVEPIGVDYKSLSIKTDHNCGGMHIGNKGTEGIILSAGHCIKNFERGSTDPTSVTYNDNTKANVTSVYSLGFTADTAYKDASLIAVGTTKNTDNIFLLENPKDLPQDTVLKFYSITTGRKWDNTTAKITDKAFTEEDIERNGIADVALYPLR